MPAATLRDVYIVDAVRTPVGKYGGALAGARPDESLGRRADDHRS
jgi:acetyl-CoA acetyltransferase